jgi:ribonuclease BN (tRNA processing enzyme)
MKQKNNIQILGAYGTKSKGFGTSSFLLNNLNVIDAGNLLNTLEEKSIEIENVWLTHSHLDHIEDIAYILDNYFHIRKKTLNIIGLPETIQAIQEHYLNDTIWPDFSKIKLNNSLEYAVTYTIVNLTQEYKIDSEKTIRAFQTDHTVESCGYIYKENESSILITADTYSLESMLDEINKDKTIKTIVVECSFPSEMEILAKESKHLTPKLLFKMLKPIENAGINLYINHIKPSYLNIIIKEIEQYRGVWQPKILKDEDFLIF